MRPYEYPLGLDEEEQPNVTTPRQILANQANAQKSTGPKTAEGIAHASANSTTHGLTAKSAAKQKDALGASELQASIDSWIDEIDAVTEFERWLAEIMAVESARCRDCRIRESELREQEALRADSSWELDRRADVEILANQLARKPSATLAQLRRSSYGVRWLKTRWEGLLRTLDAPEGWNEIERTLALDLIGAPLELRRGRTAVDPFPRAEVLEIVRRQTEENGLGDDRKSTQVSDRPIDPTDSLALKRLPALREEDATLYRCGFVEAMIEHLSFELDRLDELDARERLAASKKISPELSKELKLLRRYETAAFRRFQWSRARYAELCEPFDEIPSFLEESNEPPVDLAETYDQLRRLREDAQAKAAQEDEIEDEEEVKVVAKPEPKAVGVAVAVAAKAKAEAKPIAPAAALPTSLARKALAGVNDAWLGFSGLDRRERQPQPLASSVARS